MANAPDTFLVAGPQFAETSIGNALITPTGKVQGRLADQFGGGPAINILAFGATANIAGNWSATNTANTTALQNAINAAIAAGVPLYIPAPNVAGASYNYTAPLTINGTLSIVGDFVAENWNGNVNVPTGSPALLGSVLTPSSNGSAGIVMTGASLCIQLQNIGILFQTPFVGTGAGIIYHPVATEQTLQGALWQNVKVYGHDGDHYAFDLMNTIYNTFVDLFCYGGGGFNLTANSSINLGNAVFVHPYAQIVVGGTAHGFNLDSTRSEGLALLTFIRPQCIVQSGTGVSAGNPPTSAQFSWHQSANPLYIHVTQGDFETNVASPSLLGTAPTNDYEFNNLLSDNASIQAPAWTTNGLMYGPITRNLTDITSTGTIAISAAFAFPGYTMKASNTLTVTDLATVYIGSPTAGTNVTATSAPSLYTNGQIISNGGLVSQNGVNLLKGITQLNVNNGTASTEIGDGTTTGLLTLGGNNNLTRAGGASLATNATTGFLMLPTCAGTPTGTVAVTAGMAAIVFDTTNKKLCYTTGGGTWESSAAFTP